MHLRRAKSADRKGAHDEGSVGGGIFFFGRMVPASLVILSFLREFAVCPAKFFLPSRRRGDGLQREFDEVDEVWVSVLAG